MQRLDIGDNPGERYLDRKFRFLQMQRLDINSAW